MFHKAWLSKVGTLLVLAGLLFSPSTSLFAQADPNSADPTVTTDVEQSRNHIFLPLVQNSTDAEVAAANNNIIIPPLDFCATQAANATLTLGPGVHSVSSISIGGLYANTLCPRWIVDISVPSNSSGIGHDLRSFEFGVIPAPPSTQASCETYEKYISIYKRLAPTGFTLVERIRYKGLWLGLDPDIHGPRCREEAMAGDTFLAQPLYPPSTGPDVYRVAAGVKINGKWLIVIVNATHNSIP